MTATNFPPLFIELFTGKMGMDEKEFELVCSHFTEMTVRKKDYYLKEGCISNAKAYVKKGCSRNFVMDENGKEHILFFAFEDWWLADFESYHSGNPGKQYVQALEDSELLLIHHDDKERLFERVPAFERMFRLMVQRSYVVLQDRSHQSANDDDGEDHHHPPSECAFAEGEAGVEENDGITEQSQPEMSAHPGLRPAHAQRAKSLARRQQRGE